MQVLDHKIGLIAGNGKLPFLFAMAARRQNKHVVAAAIRGDTSPLLRFGVHQFAWFHAGELKKLFDYFRRQGVREVVMAGQVNPGNLFVQNIAMDEEFRSLFQALENRKADTIFSAVAEKLHNNGMQLLNSTILFQDYLARDGILTRREPTDQEWADIDFGQKIAKSMGGLDIGQTVVIKDKAVVAIEAMEGTDRCILRGGRIVRQGAVIVKMSKPQQDQRFDVPVIGLRTIQVMRKVKASCLAIEAGKTLVINENQCIRLANNSNITIVSRPAFGDR